MIIVLCEFVKQLLDTLFPVSNYLILVQQLIHSADVNWVSGSMSLVGVGNSHA